MYPLGAIHILRNHNLLQFNTFLRKPRKVCLKFYKKACYNRFQRGEKGGDVIKEGEKEEAQKENEGGEEPAHDEIPQARRR